MCSFFNREASANLCKIQKSAEKILIILKICRIIKLRLKILENTIEKT